MICVSLYNTGSAGLDEVLTVLLSTAMLLAGVLAFVLDNLLPGVYASFKKEKLITL